MEPGPGEAEDLVTREVERARGGFIVRCPTLHAADRSGAEHCGPRGSAV